MNKVMLFSALLLIILLSSSSSIFCMQESQLPKSQKDCPYAHELFKALAATCKTREKYCWRGGRNPSCDYYPHDEKKACVEKYFEEFLIQCKKEAITT